MTEAKHVRSQRGPIWRVARFAFMVAGLAFVAVALVRAYDRTAEVSLPSWAHLLGAGTATLLGLFFASNAWLTLLRPAVRVSQVRRAFFLAQFAKYIPGVLWHPAGQIGLTADTGVAVARASIAFPVHMLTQAIAGSVLGAGVAITASHLGWALRGAAVSAVIAVLLLRRSWMVVLLRFGRRVVKWVPDDTHVPDQLAILRSFGWSFCALGSGGIAFALLFGSMGGEYPWLTAIFAFSLSWLIGFVAIPFPSGIGVREATLAVLLGQGLAVAVAASIVHRFISILGEVVMAAVMAWPSKQDGERGSTVD